MPTNNYDNIPAEMREYKSWCLWRYEHVEGKKPTKVPYQANGYKLSTTDSNQWLTWEQAIACAPSYDGIGFVFSNSCPFSGIDLDDAEGDPAIYERQLKVFNEFNSYSELSPSGRGLHIIIRGKIKGGKRRVKSKIEVYSSEHYFTMTGNIYKNNVITENQDLLTQLWQQMGGESILIKDIKDKAQSLSDEEVLNYSLKNAKFETMHNNHWKEIYSTQSEADYAYVDILSLFSRNMQQIDRMFRASPLMRPKVNENKGYLPTIIKKSFDNMLALIDFENYSNSVEDYLIEQSRLRANAENQLTLPLSTADSPSQVKATDFESVTTGSNPVSTAKTSIQPPPGLVGELAQFIYDAAPRPVKEIALAAAIGLMAGLCGRAYNINGTGLNLYILILAKTGRGKEAAASGIDKLMNAIRLQVPTSNRFRGPGIINSGQALVRYIADKSNCFVSILGEFGLTIERISSNNANSADKMLYQMLLDLYNKSGYTQTFQPSIYSNKDDNVSMTESPAISILGESTHKLFYGALNEDMISAGLLPRFLIIEYNGKREYNNENAAGMFPSFELIGRLAELVAHSEATQNAKKVINVTIDDDAMKMLRSFDRSSTDRINESDNEVIAELWNRAHMKILRISGLIAVGINPYAPNVTIENVKWASNLVEHDVEALSKKFEDGEVGNKINNESLQVKEVLKKVRDYYNKDWEYVKKYSRVKSLHSARIIPYEYLNKRLSSMGAFNTDKKVKPSIPIANTIRLMIDTGILKECSKAELKNHNTEQKAYVLTDVGCLNDLD